MARLLLTTPEGQQVVDLAVHNTLGRHPTNSIQLLDKIVSKEHCVIERRGTQFVLKDLGSLNGTYVNGERVVGERPLKHGDDIALGSTRARLEDVPQSAPVLPAPAAHALPQPVIPSAPATARAPLPAVESPHGPVSGVARSPAAMGAVLAPAAGGFSPQPAGFAPIAAPFIPGAPVSAPRPNLGSTRIDVNDTSRAIGTQIAATQKGFLPYDQLSTNTQQLVADYERLRLSHELSREIGLERDLPSLLNKILISVFKFVRADRGVIFLKEKDDLIPGASLRRDGTGAPINVSSTILNHVIKERATVLTHDAAMDFAASKGKSMILNRISSAIVAPLLHDDDVLGVLWLDSETLAQFQQKDLEMVTRHRQPSRDVHRDQHPRQEDRAGDRQARALQPAPLAERRRARDLGRARGEARRSARRGVHRLQQRHPRLHRA